MRATMARAYRLTPIRKLANWLVKALLHAGLMPGPTYLLTVPDRNTHRPRSTPVTLVEGDGLRWIVAPYGEVGWVRNARAAGSVTLNRGFRSEVVAIEEVSPEEAGPVLKRYVTDVPLTRPYFDATPHSPVEAFVAEARRHPVFRVAGPRSR